MAAITYTSTAVNNNVIRKVHAGVNALTVTYNSGSTGISAGDVIFLARIPHGCTILDFVENHSTGAATGVFDLGVSTNLSAFATAMAQAVVNRATKGVPYDISVSDDAVNRYVTVSAVKISGSTTTSNIVNLTVYYTADR